MSKGEIANCTYEEFKNVVGNARKAKKFWHVAVKFQPGKWRITVSDALKETLTSAQLVTAATVDNMRVGLTRKEYAEFVDAVNAYGEQRRTQRR